MFFNNYSRLPVRRRRHCLSRIIIIIFCVIVFFQIKYNTFYSSSQEIFIADVSNANLVFNKPVLNCSGDPLQQWCENQIKFCDSSLILYNNLFTSTYSVILQPQFAKGKRIGGENIQDVLNQPEEDEFYQFEKEFIKLPCDIPQMNENLPNGHLPKIFYSIPSYKSQSYVQMVNETTIAVKRQDYANFYHTITDLYTVYLLCRFFQHDPKSVRILFLDAHPKGNLDKLWPKLFHSYTRLGHLKNVSSIFYRELIWSQPQWKSEIDVQQNRRVAPSFFFDFREHVLQQFNINYQINPKVNCQSLKILFLVRHNYVAHARNPSGKIARQLPNEKEVLAELKIKFSNYSNINFTSNHFEELSFVEQLNIIMETDVFVGIHGAGLTHAIFMKSNRVLVELAGSIETGLHFDIMASMNNVNFYRCLVSEGAPAITQIVFDCIMKQVLEICPR